MHQNFLFSSLIALAVITCLTATRADGQKANADAWTKGVMARQDMVVMIRRLSSVHLPFTTL
ncbi:MAG: hypothetical protein ACREEM_11565 [Blastocatellia bacterium]